MSYWDDSDKLQALNKPILSTRDCQNSYPGMIDTETMLCAGYLEGGKGMVQFNIVTNNDEVMIYIRSIMKTLARAIQEDLSYVTVKFRVWLVGDMDVQRGIIQAFIQNFVTLLIGSKTRWGNSGSTNRSLMVFKMMAA